MNTNSNNFRHTPENGDSMLHILICDDDTAFTNTLQSAIAALPDYNRRQMQTICVNDPRVLTKTDIQRADLVFLDIDMGDINGMKLARQMRAIHKDFVLIFVTNYGEYAAEGYEVNAFRFLPKLQLAEKLPSYFRQALAACRSRTRTLNVMCEGEGTNIVLDDLVYRGLQFIGIFWSWRKATRCVTYMDGRCCLAERVLLKHATFDAYSSRSNSAKS